MALFLQFLSLFLGLILVGLLGNKGYFLNLAIILLIILGNKLFTVGQIFLILLSAISIYYVAKYINRVAIRKFDPLPVREMVIGGSALSLFIGMILRPII